MAAALTLLTCRGLLFGTTLSPNGCPKLRRHTRASDRSSPPARQHLPTVAAACAMARWLRSGRSVGLFRISCRLDFAAKRWPKVASNRPSKHSCASRDTFRPFLASLEAKVPVVAGQDAEEALQIVWEIGDHVHLTATTGHIPIYRYIR